MQPTKNFWRLLVITIACLLLVAGRGEGSVAVSEYASEASCECSFKMSNLALTQHEPVVVTFSFANHSDSAINLHLGYNREAGFAFSLKQPDGKVLEFPRRPAREGSSRLDSRVASTSRPVGSVHDYFGSVRT